MLLSDSWAAMQITAAPSAGRIPTVSQTFTPLGSMGVHAPAGFMAPAGSDNVPLDYAASAQPMGHASSQAPDQEVRNHRLPLGQTPSWRQLISQPLYPERLPPSDSFRANVSSTPDLVHDTAREQDSAPAHSGLRCPLCSASLGNDLASNNDTAAPKTKAWSADLCRSKSGIDDSHAAMPEAHLPRRAPVAPRASKGSARVHAQGNDTAQGPQQHAKHAVSAHHRSGKPSQQRPVERATLQHLGKENAKQQAEKQGQAGQVAGRLQKGLSQHRAESHASAMKDESEPHGSPRSVHTSSSLISRLGMRGMLNVLDSNKMMNFDEVATDFL